MDIGSDVQCHFYHLAVPKDHHVTEFKVLLLYPCVFVLGTYDRNVNKF